VAAIQLAARGDGGAVLVARSTLAETAASERLPEQALVSTSVTVLVGLDPSITCSDDYRGIDISTFSTGECSEWVLTGGVARLERESVDEEMEVDDVTLSAVGVGHGGSRPAVLLHELCVDVVEDVGPDLTDLVDGGAETGDARVTEVVGGPARRSCVS